MKYTPKKDSMGKMISLICLIAACVGLVFSVTLKIKYGLFFQLLSLFLFVISFEFFYCYSMTTFVYILDEKNFVIIKEIGKKKQCVCNLAMSTALAIMETPRKKSDRKKLEKKYGRIGIRYNHTQVMCPKQAYSIFFVFNDTVAEIVFEPNERMVEQLRCRILENENTDSEMDDVY